MELIDWIIIGVFLASMIGLGSLFSKKAGKNIDEFFVSGRSLKWWVAGSSLIATSFAADTPLWVSALIRQYGIHAAWQYWAPLIGSALGVVLFAKMWRRSGVVTDNEILELRYSGKSAMTLRGIASGMGAIVICPLIIGWVVKAMVTISQETLGLTEDIMILGLTLSPDLVVTFIVMGCALGLCALSGLYGVVYTDLAQFAIATIGAFLLAWLSIKEVGGLQVMYDTLSNDPDWKGRNMKLYPEVTTEMNNETGAMSVWNVIGYFGILWWGVALSGGYNAQRILASKDASHASRALLLHTIVYYAVVSLPWVIVGLASLIIFPDLGEGVTDDAAYPKMILHVLPAGLRGLMIAAMIAAFISTMSTLFNWGSSYMVNDLYRRFMVRDASDGHYVNMSRVLTVFIAIFGGIISFFADTIQQLLGIFFVVGGGAAMVGVVRWIWWRVTAVGELVAFVGNWVISLLLLFGHQLPWMGPDAKPLFDSFMNPLLGVPEGMSFTSDHDFLGARMLFMSIWGLLAVVVGSLLSKPTDIERLKEFCIRTKIFLPGWRHVTSQIPGYKTAHPTGALFLDWFLVMATVVCLLFGLNSIVQVNPMKTGGLLVAFVVLLVITLKRISKEEPEGE